MIKGLNQSGIAKKVRMTQQAYSKLEKSRHIKEQKFKIIIKALQCSDKEIEWVKNYPPSGNSNLNRFPSGIICKSP